MSLIVTYRTHFTFIIPAASARNDLIGLAGDVMCCRVRLREMVEEWYCQHCQQSGWSVFQTLDPSLILARTANHHLRPQPWLSDSPDRPGDPGVRPSQVQPTQGSVCVVCIYCSTTVCRAVVTQPGAVKSLHETLISSVLAASWLLSCSAPPHLSCQSHL